MPWFSKKKEQIEAVPPEERVVKTENVFVKCDGCEAHLYKRELEESLQVCAHCGVVPLVTSRIAGRLYAVVNVNTFENVDPASVRRAAASFDGESEDARLERRQRIWIGDVRYVDRT